MTALSQLLATYRTAAVTEREKGTYFEELILTYLRNEATYRDLYSQVWTWADWAPGHGFSAKDDGIDLVAEVAGTGEFHAIQCKFYDPDYKLQKKDIDSFFTASGKKPFVHRVIIATTDHWSEHAENALVDQQPPVSKISLHDLEESQIDWSKYQPKAKPVLKAQKSLRPHQESALTAVTAGLKTADRGKLIMACGTGKTFTSLKIAEAMAGKGKRVLFLVPSLSLLSQTLTEWTQESGIPLHSFAVCSDSDVGKKKGRKEDDAVQTFAHELRYPATTDAKRLAQSVALRQDDDHMTVVFSTYHSIEVIRDAQHEHGLGDFDLIVCDEAHRTTGATFDGDDESAFVRVHDASYIRAAKRLYMTATPRIYGDSAKAVAERDNVALYSMDNEAWYGKQLFLISFSEAVKRGLLGAHSLAGKDQNSVTNADYTTAVGGEAWATEDGATVVGFNSYAQAVNSAVLGSNTWTTKEATNSVALGAGSLADRANTVSVGADNDWTDAAGVVHTAIDRQISNVAAGTEATDAVNKAQLDAVVGAVDTVAASAVAYDDDTKAKVTLGGAEGTVLTNVAAGEVSETSTDAVNGSQLFETNERVGAVETRVDDLDTRIGDVAGVVANSVTYDDASHDALTLGGAQGTVIGNVRAGTSAMDAVNFGQLDSVAAIFGGGAAFDANGVFGAPVFAVQGASYNNVGSAFAAIDGTLSSLTSRVSVLEQGLGSGVPMGTGDGLAVGTGSHAQDAGDTAVGTNATVGADGSTAVGSNSTVSAAATNSVAVGVLPAMSSIDARRGKAPCVSQSSFAKTNPITPCSGIEIGGCAVAQCWPQACQRTRKSAGMQAERVLDPAGENADGDTGGEVGDHLLRHVIIRVPRRISPAISIRPASSVQRISPSKPNSWMTTGMTGMNAAVGLPI